MAPDLDVIGLSFGVPWGHVLGHRGLTHSLAFASVLATVVMVAAFRGPAWEAQRGRLWLFLFVATASHGVLDAMTDGGSGVAFWAPFDDGRYFLPWGAVPGSPKGRPVVNPRGGGVVKGGGVLWGGALQEARRGASRVTRRARSS